METDDTVCGPHLPRRCLYIDYLKASKLWVLKKKEAGYSRPLQCVSGTRNQTALYVSLICRLSRSISRYDALLYMLKR